MMSGVGDDGGGGNATTPSLLRWFDVKNVTNMTPAARYEEDDARWCYAEHRVEVCVRLSVMLLLALITSVLVLLRVLQYHVYRSKSYSQYIIYYLGLMLCVLSLSHWAYISSAIVDFFITFLVVFQLIVIAHFFCSWAARILHWEKIFNFILMPVLVLLLCYFLAVTIWAIVKLQADMRECTQPQWLLFSSSQLILVQLFSVAVIYISRKINRVATATSNRLSQKAQLWGLVIVYQIVTVVTFGYDLALLITRPHDNDCQKFFTSNNLGIVAIYILHGTVKYLVPQWGIIILFSPLKQTRLSEDLDSLSWAQKPNYQSTFYHSSPPEEEPTETDHLIPSNSLHSINHLPPVRSSYSSVPGAILPRSSTSVHSPYNNSVPWLKTRPGQAFPTQQALLA